MSERIFEPLVERIKRQGGNVVGSQLVSRCAQSLGRRAARQPDTQRMLERSYGPAKYFPQEHALFWGSHGSGPQTCVHVCFA